ncbi:MAG: phosphoserine phosphatase SerB [Pseudomonadota bacterium]
MANGLLAVEDLDVGFDVVRTPDGGSELLELQFGSIEPAIVFNAIKHHFGACDCVVSSGGFQMPRVFISDMDSTMIGQECIDELADYAGLKDHIAAITERAMQGELDFEDALRERVALLEGLPESDITRCLEERIRPNPGARVLVQTLKARGCETVLVTGGFHHFADVVGEQIGFDRVVGNRLEVAGGKLTGKLEGPIVDSQAKRRVLEERVALAGEGAISVAIGDGANDIPMIEAATYGVAYCAKPAARAAADGRIESGDLSALLSLLGVPKSDFIAD